MKRLTSCVMSLVLAIGLMPLPALARDAGQQRAVQVAASSTEIAVGSQSADARSGVGRQLDGGSWSGSYAGLAAGIQEGSGLEQVQAAFAKADAYVVDRGFRSPALKDAFEHELPGALCYAIDVDTYYVLYRDAAYVRAAGGWSCIFDDARRSVRRDQPPVHRGPLLRGPVGGLHGL